MNDRLTPSTLDQLTRIDTKALGVHVADAWHQRIVPALQRYIEIPAKSPAFDPDWASQRHLVSVLQRAAEHVGDDLHVAVAVGAETLAALHAVFVDHPQIAPAHVRGIVIAGK